MLLATTIVVDACGAVVAFAMTTVVAVESAAGLVTLEFFVVPSVTGFVVCVKSGILATLLLTTLP